MAQIVKNLSTVEQTQVRSLGWKDPLEKGMATHSSILAWRIPWTEEPGGLESMGFERVRHSWATNIFTSLFTLRRPTFLGFHSTILFWISLLPLWLTGFTYVSHHQLLMHYGPRRPLYSLNMLSCPELRTSATSLLTLWLPDLLLLPFPPPKL